MPWLKDAWTGIFLFKWCGHYLLGHFNLWLIGLQIEEFKSERKALEDKVSQVEEALKSAQETIKQQEKTLATKVCLNRGKDFRDV